jgi:hypothetical protein
MSHQQGIQKIRDHTGNCIWGKYRNMEKNVVQNIVEPTNCCTLAVELQNTTEMKKAPEIDENKIGVNPFVQTLQIPVTKIVSSNDLIQDAEGTIVNKTLYREKTQKIEIYYHECAGDNIANLSDKAQRLLLHIMYTLKPNKDYYWLNKQHYMNRNKIRSLTTVSNALNELIRYQYLVKTCVTGWVWINPYRFFPGSRLMKYPDNKKIVDDWDQTQGIPYEKKVKKKPFGGFQKEDTEYVQAVDELYKEKDAD